MIETFFGIFVLAVFTEGIVEYFAKTKNTDEPKPWVKYIALLIGIGLCVAYKADLFAIVGLTSSVPYIGAIATGFVVGRGSNYLNDFVSKIKKS